VHSLERSSRLPAAAAHVWSRAVTEEGINDELRPLLRMTMPRSLRGKTIDEVEVGVPLGRSWILLGGLVPVDYDDLSLAELEPGRRFLERSRMAAFALWQHERIVEPEGDDSCRVTDRLGFELRSAVAWVPGLAQLARAIVAALFRHRHRRLARHHGRPAPAPDRAADQSS
jgi:ligand-binding SRPBCC domain-containing protein